MIMPIKNPYDMFAPNPMQQSEGVSILSSKASQEGKEVKAEPLVEESEHSKVVQEFLDYMKKTPAERMEDAWLKEHNMTREELENMPPEERQAVLDKMREDIKQRLEQGIQPPEKRLSFFV